MALQLAASITAFVIAFLTVPVIIKYSLRKNLVDIPGRRKIHKKVTPSMGGIAIFLGFFVSSLIWVDMHDWVNIKFILVPLSAIFFIGVRDDLVPLRWIHKLLGQLMAASLLIFLYDLRIISFYGMFGIYELPGIISYGITFLTIIVITNSYNLIDGLDGLAGTIAITSLAAFGIWFFLAGDPIFSILSFSMLGSILAFLIFNWEPSEVFMGDTGALVIGMMLAILAIHFMDSNFKLPNATTFKFQGSVGTASCFLIVPLIDTLRIIILRLAKRQSPFRPDKGHIHHSIMRLGVSHARTTIILGILQLFYIGLAVLFRQFSDRYILTGVIFLSVLLSIILDRLLRGKLNVEEAEEGD